MSLKDYSVRRDKFEADQFGALSFPCSCCIHAGGEAQDDPCRTCDHNVNAEQCEHEWKWHQIAGEGKYFQNGNAIFENIITRHKLEKRRKA